MINHNTTPRKKLRKDKKKVTQLQTVFAYLQSNVCTASMITDATGVKQKNITRFKRQLEKCGRLVEVRKDYCKSTGHPAWYITCDTSLSPKPKSTQLPLF
jgi:DNA-binding MarR family transcriptional regulator